MNARRKPTTARASVIATRTISTKWSGRRTGRNPRYARRWSTGLQCDEAEVWVREGTLSRLGEERQPVVHYLRPGEPIYGSQEAAVLRSVVSPNTAPTASTGGSEGSKPRGNESIHLNPLLGACL